MKRLSRTIVAVLVGIGLCGVAGATSFSFTGSFATDDQLQQFNFTLAATSTVTLVTWSYAGGTNQASTLIAQGGFDPWLSLYTSTGNLLQSVDNGTCPPLVTDTNTGACFDSFISQSLSAGSYILVLSQSDNQPVDTFLADGFTQTGQLAFTSSFGCSNGQFCDSNADNRKGNWAVDIDNVTTGSAATSVPEPGTFAMLAGGIAAMLAMRRLPRTSR